MRFHPYKVSIRNEDIRAWGKLPSSQASSERLQVMLLQLVLHST